jgi:hypothetical protein
VSEDNSKALALQAGGKPHAIVPTTFEEVQRMASMVVAAGMFKATDKNQAVAQATMALMQGLEIGISPMQASTGITVINGRMCIWGSLVPALIWRAGHRIEETLFGEGDAMVATCKITRSDNNVEIERSFSMQDAKKAGLLDKPGPWKQYPKRMLAMRARGFAANDGVPDVLRGMYTVEEMQDVAEEDRGPLVAAPPPPRAADPLEDDAAALQEAIAQPVEAEAPAPEIVQEPAEQAEEAPAADPEPDMKAALAGFAVACDKAKTMDRLDQLLAAFEEKFDGHIDGDVGAALAEIFERNMVRIHGKGG